MLFRIVMAITAALFFAAFLHPSMAQTNPLLGRWQNIERDQQGNPVGAVFIFFDQNGNYQYAYPFSPSPNGFVTYFGRYELSRGQYTARLDYYRPTQTCDAVCLPVPQLVNTGVPFTCSFEASPSPGLILMIDCGNGEGPQRWSRAP